MKILKLARKIHWLASLVELKDFELQTIPGVVEEPSHLREDLSKTKRNKDQLTAQNKVVFALGMEM